jgi:hypothetical protein
MGLIAREVDGAVVGEIAEVAKEAKNDQEKQDEAAARGREPIEVEDRLPSRWGLVGQRGRFHSSGDCTDLGGRCKGGYGVDGGGDEVAPGRYRLLPSGFPVTSNFTMSTPTRAPIGLLLFSLLMTPFIARADRKDRSDSRSPFPHHIALADEDGKPIQPFPTEKQAPAQPYSSAFTCGKCHEYELMSTGWHFNANLKLVNPGRPGEPWIYIDAVTRTQIPLSYRGWKGTWEPKQVGITDFGFIATFGRQFPGGGPGEVFVPPTPENATKEPEAGSNIGHYPEEPKSRWPISGPLQIDCLICHNADNTYDANERGRAIMERENFRWAATAAAGLANVTGNSARLLPADWDPAEAKKPDTDQKAGPTVAYSHGKVEAGGETVFNVTRTPPSSRCYFCHTAMAPPQERPRWQHEGDIHLAKGLKCADCHRNGVDHMTVRGYENEWEDRKEDKDFVAALSCRGCHLGIEDAKNPQVAQGGHMAAPHPEHKGLPDFHLDKLSCTACHSGPIPESKPELVQTSMAHALGIVGAPPIPKLRGASQLPLIAEPIYLRDSTGKIAPHRIVWPNFWGFMKKDGSITPMEVAALVKAERTAFLALFPAIQNPTTSNPSVPLTDQQVIAVLKAIGRANPPTTTPSTPPGLAKALKVLGAGPDLEPVYITNGHLLRLQNGQLVSSDNAAAEPYAWPLGHDVRPANQALGARGCGDCHSTDSPIYFGNVAAVGPLTGAPVTRAMYQFRGDNGFAAALFARSFIGRTPLKVICFSCAAVIAFILLLYALRSAGEAFSQKRRA